MSIAKHCAVLWHLRVINVSLWLDFLDRITFNTSRTQADPRDVWCWSLLSNIFFFCVISQTQVSNLESSTPSGADSKVSIHWCKTHNDRKQKHLPRLSALPQTVMNLRALFYSRMVCVRGEACAMSRKVDWARSLRLVRAVSSSETGRSALSQPWPENRLKGCDVRRGSHCHSHRPADPPERPVFPRSLHLQEHQKQRQRFNWKTRYQTSL